MAKNNKLFLKISICMLLIFAFFPFANFITTVYADEEKPAFSIEDLISQNGEGTENDQELTGSLGINTDFESGTSEGWTTPVYGETSIVNPGVADFTSPDGVFTYGDEAVKYNTIGTDGLSGNKYGLLFLLNEKGVAGIESPEIVIPAHGYFVLTFNVKVVKLDNTSTNYGINAKVIDQETNKIVAMDAIKSASENYVTYAFLIQGNEFKETRVKLQILFGNIVESGEDEDKTTTKNEQIGYAAVDTMRLFSVDYKQFNDLTEDKKAQKASFLTQNSNYVYIPNGYFNVTDNQNWNVNNYNSLSDLRPANWTQKVSGGTTDYGVINTNKTIFETIANNLGLDLVNPKNADGSDITTNHNNVLVLANDNGYQTIQSSTIVLTKNKYYEISFKFNTPANANQTNSLNFYIIDNKDKVIYSNENIYSYVEYDGTNNEWATFHAFIKVDSTDRNVKFVIEFGTEENPTTGVAFIDDVRLNKFVSATSAFENTEENKYILKAEEGETEVKYLPTGPVTFDDLLKLDPTKEVNRSLIAYSYDAPVDPTNPDDGDDDTTAPSSNPSISWYIVPSILFGVCLIAGIVIFYIKKIKIKRPSKKTKNAYDRNKTLNKQVEQRERDQKILEKENFELQLQQVRKEIEDLEASYETSNKNKKSQLGLNSYLSKRQKLQNKEMKILEQLDKIKK